MITTNIDLSERLINGQIGTVKFNSINQNEVNAIYVAFYDVSARQIRINGNDLITGNNTWVPTKREEASIYINKYRTASLVINRTLQSARFKFKLSCYQLWFEKTKIFQSRTNQFFCLGSSSLSGYISNVSPVQTSKAKIKRKYFNFVLTDDATVHHGIFFHRKNTECSSASKMNIYPTVA